MSKPPEKIVYFVRHGQSEGNVAPVFQSLDSPLNDLGKKQAERIAQRISKLSFQAMIVSPLMRTKQTAEAITELTGVGPEFSDLFVERIKPSRIVGKPYGHDESEKICRAWERSLYTSGMRVEDGENYDDLVVRATQALEFLKNRPEKSLVVVTHGYFMRVLVACVLLGDALSAEAFKNFQSHIKMENTGLTVIDYEEGWEGKMWRLWIYNDHAHLAD